MMSAMKRKHEGHHGRRKDVGVMEREGRKGQTSMCFPECFERNDMSTMSCFYNMSSMDSYRLHGERVAC